MIAITGSIGTGKSEVCAILKEKGYEVIDADDIAHKILNENSVQIRQIFGEDFLDKNNKPDRKKLSKLIFSCNEAKEKLENLLHTRIFEKIELEAKNLEKKNRIYFLDIPLLFESKNSYNYAFVCTVYAPKEIEIKRIMKRDNIKKEDALKNVNSQIDIEIKRQKSDFVIDNSKDKKHLIFEVELFLEKLKEKYENCKI